MDNVWKMQGAQTLNPQIELQLFNIKLYQIQTWIWVQTANTLCKETHLTPYHLAMHSYTYM